MVTYELVTQEDVDDHWGVKITDGKYTDVTVVYGAVSVDEVEDDPNGNAVLSFQFSVVEPKEEAKTLENEDEFKMLCGDVLQDIILKSIDTDNYKIGDMDEQSGNDDTTQPDSERAVRASGYSVSEG